MAAVLSSEDSYFSSAPMRRSHSQSNLGGSLSYHHMADLSNPYAHPPNKSFSDSDHSSAPSSPRTAHIESADVSYTSTPSSNLSVASDYEDLAIDSPEDPFGLPPFTADKLYMPPQIQPDDNLEPPPSPHTGDSYTVSPAEHDSSVSTSRPDSPELSDHAEDDTAIASKPSRQVDYLSHEWREEDIWSSWRYIISKRGEFPNSARLENASWRTWMKAKNNLKTISPETLNWLKDYDVTWLYGPLQSGKRNVSANKTGPSSVSLSKSSSLVNLNKKTILKKRSMSEILLQRSLSTSSLIKQAAAAVHAQEYRRSAMRPSLGRANTDYVSLSFSSRRMSHENSSAFATSTESSSVTSPCTERKHIHFNEQVEQCIAVDVKGDDDDDVDMDMDMYGDESDSDDGVMMKRVRSKRRPLAKQRAQKKAAIAEGKIIAMLPSTTLKYQEDSPDSQDSAMKHSTGARSPLLSPSSSQETLRPSKTNAAFFFDEDEEDLDATIQSPGWLSPPSDTGAGGLKRSTSSNSLLDEPAGMRRTPSGMFMPCDEAETSSGEGIFGRVIDTVNTARDIAHVIWNVGWRK